MFKDRNLERIMTTGGSSTSEQHQLDAAQNSSTIAQDQSAANLAKARTA